MHEDRDGTGAASPLRVAAQYLDESLTSPEALDPRQLQDLLAAATRAYAAAGSGVPALATGGTVSMPTATEVAVTASALLEAASIEPFELGLWQAWGGVDTAATTSGKEDG